MQKYFSNSTPVDNVIKNIIEPLLKKNGGTYQASLITQWEKIVGIEIAKLTQPIQVRFKKAHHLEARLILQVEPAGAVVIGFRKDLILQKITSFFGKTLISDIQFIQKSLSRTAHNKEKTSKRTKPQEKISLDEALSNLGNAIKQQKS